MPLGQKDTVAEHLVAMHDLDVRDPLDGRPERQEIVVVGGPLELAADLDHDQEMARVFDVAIGDAPLAQELGPAHLEVDDVVGVMQEAHAVGLGVADAKADLVTERHRSVLLVLTSASARDGRRPGDPAPATVVVVRDG